MDEFIAITNLVRDYNKDGGLIRAVEIKELTFPQEGVVFVRGKSGAGKTTLLNMIGLLDSPTSGKIIINGKDISGIEDDKKTQLRKENFGFIFQAFNLIPTLTVEENIFLALLSSDLKKGKIAEVDNLLERVGLARRKKHFPAELSQGEQQRVAIVRALINDPKAILADEPTSNLDQDNTKNILDLLFNMVQERKTLLVIASNDAELMARKFSQEVRLEQGKIVC